MLGSAERQAAYDQNGPPWDGTQTLFEVLGVPEDATQQDIEEAYGRHHEAALKAGRAVSASVRYAWSRLLVDGWREFYRDRLTDCRSKQARSVPADKRARFFEFCEQARINFWPDPVAPGEYHLRLPGQKPPDFVVEAARIQNREQQRNTAELERQADRQFKRANAGKLFFLRFGYVYAFAFAGVALFALILVLGFDGTFSRWLHVTGVLEDREAKQVEKEGREALALAADSLARLEEGLSSLRDAVRTELGVSLDGVATSDELTALVDKEPTASTAWNAVRAAYAAREGLADRKRSRMAIEGRVNEKTFLKADLETLREMNVWATAATTALKSTSRHIQHVRAMLDAERFSRVGQESPKEP